MEARNLYSWNNMISGYVKLGMMKQAQGVFDRMPERDFVSWNTMIVGHTSLPLVPPLVPLLVAAAAGGTDHHSHSLLPLLTTNPSLFTMSTSRQVLDSNAPTPGSAGPTVGTVSVDPAAPVRSNRVDPG
ncbi:hypothetical protein HN51_022610 [Arachis hypogaea]